ncbi:MAG: hypothetical protein WBF08_04590 [Candidatus Bathyarchaeia archaeon]
MIKIIKEQTQKSYNIFVISLIIILISLSWAIQFSVAQETQNIDCTDCHSRLMERHQFPNYPCTSCHNQDMSTISLRTGSIIPLEESGPLCAQCHNDIHNAWKEGKHGITELKCVECHDPHSENKKFSISTLKASSFSSVLQMISASGAFIGILLAVLAAIKIK